MGDTTAQRSSASPSAAAAPPPPPKLELESSSVFETSLDSEYQSLGETIKSYVIFSIALFWLSSVQANFSFFYVLVVFVIFFIATAWIKAYLSALRATKNGSSNRTLIANGLLLNELALGFVTILLVQIIMARATPFFADGNFNFSTLVMPFLLFALIFGESYARRARMSLIEAAAESANKTE
jgi:hypothetical protein